jgi:hypothetical protein
MHHVALNWPWANDRDFNHDIVKTFRLQSRQRRHLSPTFDLENSDGVGRLHHLESFGVVLRNVSQIEWAATFTTKLKRILHYRHHAEPKQIDFHNAEVFAIILVPLRHHPPRHRRIFQWHKRAQFILTNNHPAGVLPEMARQSVNCVIQTHECRHSWVGFRQTSLLNLRFELESVRKIAVREQMRKAIESAR